MVNNDIVAIIPARGGSKGLEKKNIKMLEGKPLLAYSIRAALDCPYISRCLVSTEDSEIKSVSRECGAEVIDRPSELATDYSLTQDAVRHVLETLYRQSGLPEYFILLQPTSPLRTSKNITQAIESYFSSQAQCCISVTDMEHHPYKAFTINDDNLIPLFGTDYLHKPRQLLPRVVRQNGAIYLMPSQLFLETNTFFVEPALPYYMTEKESIDIDNESDLLYAAALLQKSNFI